MNLLKLELKNYRNCDCVNLDLDNSKILIIGKNAQGKTNILESVFFLSKLKSPRTSNTNELIKFGANYMELSAELVKNNTEIKMDYRQDAEKKREIKINGVKSTQKEFKSIIKTVLFSTKDLLLLRGNPQDRRDWLDSAISQIYPAYEERLTKYEKIRKSKNNLLKDNFQNPTLLDVYNEQLVICGSNIIFLRKKFLAEMEKIAKQKHANITETEEFTIKYECSFLNDEDQNIEEIAQKFSQDLESRKDEEIRRAQSCIGPHRDDVDFYINQTSAEKFASQGQQRTIVLSLKLSELEMISEKTGENPILLLDDVLAELDEERQNFLLKSIDKTVQTIITSVDTLLFDEKFLKTVRIFKVQNGTILHDNQTNN